MRRALPLLLLLACGGRVETSPTATTTAGPSPSSPTRGGEHESSTADIVTVTGYSGGLSHVFIYATDSSSDDCLTLHLTYPETAKELAGIVTPKEWGVASAIRSRGTDHCGPGQEPPTAESALDGDGVIEFASNGGAVPCALTSVKITLTFRSRPETVTVSGANVAVQGCQ